MASTVTELMRRRMMGARGSSIDWESIARGMIDGTTVFNVDSLIEGKTSLGVALFYGRTGLQSIELPSTLTSISSSLFSECTGLTSIVIPNSVITIGDSAFKRCSNLTSITIGSAVTSISTMAFQDCSKVTSLVFPNSVTFIGIQCCRSMSNLQTVDIGTGITSIQNMAFYGCSKVQYYIVRAISPPTLGSSSLAGVSDYAIYVPDASVNTYKAVSGWSNYASKIFPISDLTT